MNCLGYGHGGKSLIDTKFKKAEKPEWFSTKLTFGQYEHPSKEVVQKNEFLIEGILTYYGYDVLTYCNFPPMIEQKTTKPDKKNDKVPSENISSRSEEEIFEQEQEGDIEETDLEQKEAKIRKSVQNKRARNLKHQENFIDDDQEMLAKKRKQKQPAKRREVELSDFEKNVIRKNIEERKKMEQELGIHTLAQELKACSKTNFLSNMESMLDSDDEN